VTVFDKSARKDGTFSREDFNYDQTKDVYICPGGKHLTTKGTRVNDGDTTGPMMSSSLQQQLKTCGN
jgi:hypothetical protein